MHGELFIEMCSFQWVYFVRVLFDCFFVTHIDIMINSIGPTWTSGKISSLSWINCFYSHSTFSERWPNFPCKFASTSELCYFIAYSCCLSSLLSFWLASISRSSSWFTSLLELQSTLALPWHKYSYLHTLWANLYDITVYSSAYLASWHCSQLHPLLTLLCRAHGIWPEVDFQELEIELKLAVS